MDWFSHFSLERYLGVCLFALLLPVLIVLPLINEGEIAEGKCLYNNNKTWSLIQVELGQYNYEITLMDALYEPGEKMDIAYDPENTDDYVVLGFAGIYLNIWGVLSSMMIFVGTALYFSARDDKYEKAQKNKWVFNNPWKNNPFIKNRRR